MYRGETDVREKMKEKGILVFSLSARTLKEEIPEAYKTIDEVVEATEEAGISRRVARMLPAGGRQGMTRPAVIKPVRSATTRPFSRIR